MVQPVWFTPTTTREWDVACSQLCGLGHFRMRGVYAFQSKADFDAWPAKEALGVSRTPTLLGTLGLSLA